MPSKGAGTPADIQQLRKGRPVPVHACTPPALVLAPAAGQQRNSGCILLSTFLARVQVLIVYPPAIQALVSMINIANHKPPLQRPSNALHCFTKDIMKCTLPI
eukprot:1143894-Pelagomonas_calceolata.AAC.13